MNAPRVATPALPISQPQRDRLALLLIVLGYALAMLLMSPRRDFAITDDWSYYRAVEQIVNGHGYTPPDWAQMTLVFHAYWGALFALLLGLSFTSLTIATLTMSMIGTLGCYLLLRRLGFGSRLAGLGAAVLACNPEYLSSSYSYMTEVTFVATLLLSMLAYINGLDDNNKEGWLWLGSLFAACAFLTRQFGLALPFAAIAYLLYNRRLNLRRGLAVAALPLVAALGFALWRSGYPPTTSDSANPALLQLYLSSPDYVLLKQGATMLYWLPALGLSLPLFNPLRRKWLLLVWLPLIGLSVYGINLSTAPTYAANEPLAEPAIGQPFALDNTWFWWLGVVTAAWLFAGLSERGVSWLLTILHRRRSAQPHDFIYLTTLVLFLGSYALSWYGLAPRYQLPWLPAFIIVLLPPLRHYRPAQLRLIFVAVILVATYAVTQHLDEYAFYHTRWQAGQSVIGQGVSYDKLDNSFAWTGYYLYDEAIRRTGKGDFRGVSFAPLRILDRAYLIAPRPKPGYRVVATFPYFSILDGWRNHDLLVQQRTP